MAVERCAGTQPRVIAATVARSSHRPTVRKVSERRFCAWLMLPMYALLAALHTGGTAFAQSSAERERCIGKDNAPFDARIIDCTKVLESGETTPGDRAAVLLG